MGNKVGGNPWWELTWNVCRKKGVRAVCPASLPGPGIWVAKKGVNLAAYMNLLKL